MWKHRQPNHRFKVKSSGYIFVYRPNHPNKNLKGYVREHRVIFEEKIGRFLKSNEIIHHIDGNPSNNNPSNLELMTRSEHSSHHGNTPGWGNWNCGRRNGNAKFTDKIIKQIRHFYNSGKYTSPELAKIFSTVPEYIRSIVTRRCWTHI